MIRQSIEACNIDKITENTERHDAESAWNTQCYDVNPLDQSGSTHKAEAADMVAAMDDSLSRRVESPDITSQSS